MANTRRTRAYRGGSKRTSGSGALIDTVRNTLTNFGGNRGRSSRGRGGLASQASGFIGGLLSGGDSGDRSSNRSRGRRNR
jgi:hypothetical protein